MERYAVDRNRVILSGFSSGGNAAMEVILQNRLPVKGFIALCPDKPESWNDDNLIRMKDRGIRAILLTTELDPRVEMQREMAAQLESLGVKYDFIVTPNTGHWIPEDLPDKLNAGVKFLFEK